VHQLEIKVLDVIDIFVLQTYAVHICTC